MTDQEKLKEVLGDLIVTEEELKGMTQEEALKKVEEFYPPGSPGSTFNPGGPCCPFCGQPYVQGFCACSPGPVGTYYKPR